MSSARPSGNRFSKKRLTVPDDGSSANMLIWGEMEYACSPWRQALSYLNEKRSSNDSYSIAPTRTDPSNTPSACKLTGCPCSQPQGVGQPSLCRPRASQGLGDPVF